jgi:predicted secreted protein
MSTGVLGHGTTLTGTTSGVIGNIISLSVSGRTRDMVDISTFDSTDKFREYIAGFADEGELTAEVNFDDGAISTAINTAYQAATSQTWTVDFGTKTWAITGIVTGFNIDVPHDGKQSMSITIKATGKGTWT